MSRPTALVGFMGAGKSTVGRLLADERGVPFADADAVLEAEAGRSIPELFERGGRAGVPRPRARRRRPAPRRRRRRRGGARRRGGRRPRDARAAGARGRRRLARRRRRHRLGAGGADERDASTCTRRGARSARCTPAGARSTPRRPTSLVDAAPAPELVAAAVRHAPVVRAGALERLPELVGDRRAVLVVDAAVADRVAGNWTHRVVVEGGEEAKTVAAAARALAGAGRRRARAPRRRGRRRRRHRHRRRRLRGRDVPARHRLDRGADDAGRPGRRGDRRQDGHQRRGQERRRRVPRPRARGVRLHRPGDAAAARVGRRVRRGGEDGAARRRAAARARRGVGARRRPTGRAASSSCAAAPPSRPRVVAEDPTERGRRAILNLGHTIGHGIEAAAGYGGLLHGEAVAVGLSAALWLSVQLHGLDPAVLAGTEALLQRHGLPIRAPGVDADAVRAAMRGDKKRAAGRPRMVLLDAVGRPCGASTPVTARSTQRSSGPSAGLIDQTIATEKLIEFETSVAAGCRRPSRSRTAAAGSYRWCGRLREDQRDARASGTPRVATIVDVVGLSPPRRCSRPRRSHGVIVMLNVRCGTTCCAVASNIA